MNHQGISEISFEETYSVPPEQTARALFSRLPHGGDYAQRLIECLATGYLVAVVESICIREMQRHVDADSEVVVGRTIELEHKGPIPPGSTLKLRGWVERLGSGARNSACRHQTTTKWFATAASFWWWLREHQWNRALLQKWARWGRSPMETWLRTRAASVPRLIR